MRDAPKVASNKAYLGDSVYVEYNQFGQWVLTTENGYGPSNTIFLEPEVLNALFQYAKKHAQGLDTKKL